MQLLTSNGLLQFELGPDSQWKCLQFSSEETLDISKWTTYLTAFTNLRMVAPVSDLIDESYGLASPLAKVVIQYTENNESKTGELLIGKQDENDLNYYAKWSISPYVVKIASFNAERMINITKSELISVPELQSVHHRAILRSFQLNIDLLLQTTEIYWRSSFQQVYSMEQSVTTFPSGL